MARGDSPPRAVLDANVLLKASLRDTLLRAAEEVLFVPVWGETILAEVERNLPTLIRNRPDAHERAERLVQQLQRAFPKAKVDNGLDVVPTRLIGPGADCIHPGDIHVAAAACRAGARTIVTHNVRHFPSAALAPLGIDAVTPDRFLLQLWASYSQEITTILIEQGAALNPPRTMEATLDALALAVPEFVAAVRQDRGDEELSVP